MMMVMSDDESTLASLWQDLSTGKAGWPVKIVVSLLLAAALAGMGMICSYALAVVTPEWNRSWGNGVVYPDEGLIAVVMGLAAVLYVLALAWVWSRGRQNRALVYAVILSILTIAVTIILGIMAEESIRGASELIIGGIVCLGFATLLLIWLNAVRKYRGHRPRRLAADGLLDVRCPECGYRMVGLHESRCPECGTSYTLDELLSKQSFSRQAPPGPLFPPPLFSAPPARAAAESPSMGLAGK